MRKEWEKLLKQQLEQDKTTLIKLTRKDNKGNEIDLGTDLDSIKVKQTDICTIMCSKCNKLHTLAVREVIKTSSFCKTCKLEAYYKKKGFIFWSFDVLWDFWEEKKMEEPEKSKDYNWWLEKYPNFVAALQDRRAKYPNEELPFISIKQSRTAGGKHLWKEVLEVYEDEGVKGLTKKNINNKQNFYTFIVNQKIIPKTPLKNNVNYPCIEVCKKLKEFFPEKCLNILKERTSYLKITFPRECTWEELVELHIKPILPIIFKENGLDGALLTHYIFRTKFRYSNIVSRWSKLGKGIDDVRDACGMKKCGENQYIDLYGFVHRSQFEMRIFNFLYKIGGVKVKKPDNPYPQEFIDATGHRCLDDGAFYSVNQEKWIIIEAWGDNNNKGTKRTNSTKYKNSFQHGGISMEEMIILDGEGDLANREEVIAALKDV